MNTWRVVSFLLPGAEERLRSQLHICHGLYDETWENVYGGCAKRSLRISPSRILYSSMSCILQQARPSRALRVFHGVRCNSTPATLHANSHPATPTSSSTTKSQKRPHLGIDVDPKHGLWAFFRKKEVDGVVKHETLEARESLTESGVCCLG